MVLQLGSSGIDTMSMHMLLCAYFIVCSFYMKSLKTRNGSRKKKQRNDKTNMGEIHHICLVRWQQQAEWRRTGINFADSHNIILVRNPCVHGLNYY